MTEYNELKIQLEEKFDEFMNEINSDDYSFHDEKMNAKIHIKYDKNNVAYWKSETISNCKYS